MTARLGLVSASSDTKEQIARAIAQVTEEVPALAPLKLVFSLELRGRGDVQQFRVELPGPKITKEIATDARVNVVTMQEERARLRRAKPH